MLKPGIQMRLQSQTPDNAIVMTVDMRIDAIQPLKNRTDRLLEVLGERDARLGGEDRRVGEVVGGPG